ncbi:MAG: thioredoxin [Verrucomicrobiaceae bacterium]|nr:thioredoxin [Verrucomicrobiaceae bacterium]
MPHHLSSDARGLILSCPACGTASRIAYANLDKAGRCGSCKADLPKPSAPVVIDDITTFQAMVANSPLPIVIDFWAPWCGPCKMMAPEFAKAATLAAGEAIFAKVNTDEQQAIASQFRIQGIPAFALLKGGKLIAQTAGFQSASNLLAWMRQA